MKIPYTTLSYLGQETMKADAHAFAAFMCFLKDYDSEQQTVVAVQVENETGLLGAAREVSDEADALFAAPVPADFAAWMRSHIDTMTEEMKAAVTSGKADGDWSAVFGAAAEEVFSAYHAARFLNTVAEAGKKVYPLPMTANCWLDKGDVPGSYPTGGPVSKVHEVWDFCAPNIDVYCPDIYIPQFKAVCDEYTRRGAALFIPEAATHSYCAPRLVYTVGYYHAMCYSPFGFDDIGKPFTAAQAFLFGVDVTDPALKTPQDFEEYAAFGHILREMMPMLASAYGTDRLQAVSSETDPASSAPNGNLFGAIPTMVDFGAFCLHVGFQSSLNPRTDGVCLCLAVSDTECWIVGNACSLTFSSRCGERPNLDLLLVEEDRFENSTWLPGRRLNGDETANLSLSKPAVLHVKFFTYE